uniref:NADH-ubiquinone oxidoreductase chain 6 n=1 Tax=Hydrochus sp. BMNH 840193 TaxID=904168 RepID=E3VSX2_9COLE|nr:NADH dehydrogenase subunit 6 [Hydrochus sp. BMNH 840193]
MSILLMMILINSFIFIMLNHPMSMGLMLLMQTFTISLTTGFMNFNWWFSYILFIIMIGGMLILFIYMTSIASNEKFSSSYLIPLFFSILLFMSLLIMFNDNFIIEYFNINNLNIMNSNNKIMLSKFLNIPSNMIMLTMIIYLLITLIAVAKITNISKGPLRQMN